MFCDNSSNKYSFLRELYIEINSNKVITFISENCHTLLGYISKELLNKPINHYISEMPEDIISNINFQTEITTKDGILSLFDIVAAPITNDKNRIIGSKLSLVDISKYSRNSNEEKRLFQMFQRCKDIIYCCDLVPEFKFTYISPSVEEILGYTVKEYMSDSLLVFKIAHPDDHEALIKKNNNDVDYSSPIPTRFKHKNGQYVWLDDFCTPIYDCQGNLIALEGFSRDVTEKRELERKLEKLSFYDGLTGLYNKLYFEKQVSIFNAEQDTSIGVFFCDLDNLKITNDILGHEFGDKLIVNTSNILKDTFKESAVISRIGGDEFIVLLKDTSLDKVKILYSELYNSIEQHNKYNKEVPISISVGYSFSESSIGVIGQVINIADKNMYKDKQTKRNSVSI